MAQNQQPAHSSDVAQDLGDLAAAFRDRRFAPLGERELAAIRIEVSLLTRAEPIRFATEGTRSSSCAKASTA
jgi:AMMECR1 domain-containing protein